LNYRENKKVAHTEQCHLKYECFMVSLDQKDYSFEAQGAALSAEMQIDFLTILHRTS